MKLLISSFISIIYIIYTVEGAGGGTGTHNSIGTTESAEHDNTKLIKIDKPLELQCKMPKAKEAMTVKWSKDGADISSTDEHYKLVNSTLLIEKAALEDIGVYKCEFGNENFEIHVIQFSYKKLPKSMTVLQGDKLAISCEVVGTPTPSISWLKNKNELEEPINNTSHYTLEPNEKGIANSTFVVPSVVDSDRAEYTCLIKVSGGATYNSTTFVRVKDMYAALWPFLGICAEVFLLCLIIFIYEKKRAKADFEESDTDQPTDGKNKSDNKDSVRQRK